MMELAESESSVQGVLKASLNWGAIILPASLGWPPVPGSNDQTDAPLNLCMNLVVRLQTHLHGDANLCRTKGSCCQNKTTWNRLHPSPHVQYLWKWGSKSFWKDLYNWLSIFPYSLAYKLQSHPRAEPTASDLKGGGCRITYELYSSCRDRNHILQWCS